MFQIWSDRIFTLNCVLKTTIRTSSARLIIKNGGNVNWEIECSHE